MCPFIDDFFFSSADKLVTFEESFGEAGYFVVAEVDLLETGEAVEGVQVDVGDDIVRQVERAQGPLVDQRFVTDDTCVEEEGTR